MQMAARSLSGSDRTQLEQWIAPDLQRIEAAMENALQNAGITAGNIDRIFLTGGRSLIPAIRTLFQRRFGQERIAAGDKLTFIAHGLAIIGMEDDHRQ
jgi:hypothetical chaperone protein